MGKQFLLHYKTLVRKLKIEKHELHKIRCSGWVSSSSLTSGTLPVAVKLHENHVI